MFWEIAEFTSAAGFRYSFPMDGPGSHAEGNSERPARAGW